MADPLDGVQTGPVIFTGPASVSMRPIDPREGNEWTDLGVATSLKITPLDEPDGTPAVPMVQIPYDEFLFADE